jgi:ribosome-binding factor A
MSLRLQRVRELLKRQIGEVVRREFPAGPGGLVSVNDVQVASDLHSATVFIGVLGSAEQQQKALRDLEASRKRLQGLVARAVILKYTPQFRFVLDGSIERGNKILRILDELEKTDPPA